MKRIAVPVVAAIALWFLMFSPWTAGRLNFWLAMSVSALILTAFSVYNRVKEFRAQFQFNLRAVFTGVVSAAVLWGIFYAGDKLSALLFNFAKPQILSIYSLKEGMSPVLLVALLLFLIGPAEEIFWRGFVQRKLERYGEGRAFLATTAIYALAHIWSFNFMLVAAALICGGFWGFMYKRSKNVLPLVISHALWDAAVFVIFPIN